MIEQIKASAGSGKTYRLTRRFLELLLQSGRPALSCGPAAEGESGPEGILAITFTNRAATEMKERVLKDLKGAALGLPGADFLTAQAGAKAKAVLEQMLKHLHLLNIRTIDSLLHQLARLFALELGLPPDFEAEIDEAALFETLYDLLSARLETGDQDLRRLFENVTEVCQGQGGFWLAQRVKTKLREVFRHLLEGKGSPDMDAQALRRELDGLHQNLRATATNLRAALDGLGAVTLSDFASFLAALESGSGGKSLPESAFAHKADLAECLRKQSQGLLSPDVDELYQELKRRYLAANTQGAMLKGALACQPFLLLGRELMASLAAFRRDQATALLSELPGKVSGLLASGGGVPEAYCRLGARLVHLLIDEFQDTSLAQWEVLAQLAQECLAKGGSLFYVGDVKQAIYGWRGGDASLFARAAAPTRQETLGTNWRSAREVVNFNNRVFTALAGQEVSRNVAEALLAKSPKAAKDWLAKAIREFYAEAGQALPKGRADSGFVRLVRLPGDSPADFQEEVRLELARLFQEDLLRRHGPEDIAVLTRTNSEASLAAQWLVDLDIPVVTENSLRLSEHPVIQGALAFLAFMDYPPDNLALWRFLSCRELFGRSRLISDQQLMDWLVVQSKGLLYRKFQRDFPEVWEEFFAPFLHGPGLTTPYDLVRELFSVCQVFTAYPQDEVFLSRFLELVHKAENQGYGSLSSFLEFWQAQGAKEKIPQPEQAGAVRVMTIHKAKGLEFPVVVAPFHQFPTTPGGELADFQFKGQTMTARLVKDLGEPYHEHLARNMLEQLNLLYVAWTRPVQELHALLPASPKLAGRYPMISAVNILGQAMGLDPAKPETIFGAPPARPRSLVDIPESGPVRAETALPAEPLRAWPPMDWLPGLKIMRCELSDPGRDLGLNERKRGLALHKALEFFRQDLPLEQAAPMAARQGLAALSLPGDETLAADLTRHLLWLNSLDFFSECLRLGLREAQLLDHEGQLHRPDLLVFGEKETLVLDYKTGGQDPEHQGQVRRYLSLAAKLPQGRGRPLRGLLLYVDLEQLKEIAWEPWL